MVDMPELDLTCYTYGNEKNTYLILDNFYPDPQQLITEATLGDSFAQQKSDYYPGIRKAASQTYSDYVARTFGPILKNQYSIANSKQLTISLCAYSIAITPESALRPIQCVPHIDTHDEYQFAVVHYLCQEVFSGTSLYRHRSTGYESISQERLTPYFVQLKKEVMAEAAAPKYINGTTSLFEKVDEIALKFNRAAIYPSNLLHSGNIDPLSNLSSDPRKGRLTMNTFINFRDAV